MGATADVSAGITAGNTAGVTGGVTVGVTAEVTDGVITVDVTAGVIVGVTDDPGNSGAVYAAAAMGGAAVGAGCLHLASAIASALGKKRSRRRPSLDG